MDSQYYRTFIAVPLQVDMRFLQARTQLIEALRDERISWTNPEQYHVTLRFLGDTELSVVNEIIRILPREVHVPKQIMLKTDRLASFGPRKRPRVLWVGFEENDILISLKLEVDRVLEKCGITPGDQPFRAHLTLGRIRHLKNPQKYHDSVEEMAQEFSHSLQPGSLVFFQSILGMRGPEYRVLKEIQFLQ